MTAKQQIATGFLAALIICSVAFMPASADSNTAPGKATTSRPATPVVATKTAPAQASAKEPRDLTYN